ncbi:hypothetical protein BJV74DRAFT_444881 [Russula compacta]|nr:hypothetical protein BJV74DRAFT_444881 [Russula compacta]
MTRSRAYFHFVAGPVKWNHNQESSLFQNVSPFSPAYDGRSTTTTLSERIRELYLQFLWLPESIMPLDQFVHAVQLLVARPSATAAASPDDVHPLHAGLDGILLTGKWCSYKYQEQLPNAIVHASSTDLEAAIMFFVLERHALLPEQPKEPVRKHSLDEKKRWLSEIEKREVKMQILLHLLKLSLPGQCPCIPIRPVPVTSSYAQKRRRVQPSSDDEDDTPTPRSILEDRLEGFMDKLVLWQMALPDAETGADGTKSVRDWTQIFCDDVVQPAFAQKLPEQYKLLRRKLFRIPQWTSSSSDSDAADADADADADTKSVAQEPDPHALFNSHANGGSTRTASAAQSQSRSRSLSVSLEQEAGLRRTESRPRKVLQREVSMSKVFKGRRNDGPNAPPPRVKVEAEVVASSSTTQAQVRGPIVLVEGTPQKPKAKSRSTQA